MGCLPPSCPAVRLLSMLQFPAMQHRGVISIFMADPPPEGQEGCSSTHTRLYFFTLITRHAFVFNGFKVFAFGLLPKTCHQLLEIFVSLNCVALLLVP